MTTNQPLPKASQFKTDFEILSDYFEGLLTNPNIMANPELLTLVGLTAQGIISLGYVTHGLLVELEKRTIITP